jgi:hypothetical protein
MQSTLFLVADNFFQYPGQESMESVHGGFKIDRKIGTAQIVIETQELIPVFIEQVIQVGFHELVNIEKYFRRSDAVLVGKIIVDGGMQFNQFFLDLDGFLFTRYIVFKNTAAADFGLEKPGHAFDHFLHGHFGNNDYILDHFPFLYFVGVGVKIQGQFTFKDFFEFQLEVLEDDADRVQFLLQVGIGFQVFPEGRIVEIDDGFHVFFQGKDQGDGHVKVFILVKIQFDKIADFQDAERKDEKDPQVFAGIFFLASGNDFGDVGLVNLVHPGNKLLFQQ